MPAETHPGLAPCPACGASNPPGAPWCGQCLRRLDEPAHAGAPANGSTRTVSNGTVSNGTVSNGTAAPAKPLAAAAGWLGRRPTVRRRGERVLWVCPACEAENAIDAAACGRCGSPFTSFFSPPSRAARPRASAGVATAAAAALPGLGHWLLGEVGPAIARGVLYAWTLGLGILLLVRPPSVGRVVVRGIGTIFVLSAAGVWLLSMLETMRLGAGDRRPLVPPRALTWFSAALSGVLFLGLMIAALIGR